MKPPPIRCHVCQMDVEPIRWRKPRRMAVCPLCGYELRLPPRKRGRKRKRFAPSRETANDTFMSAEPGNPLGPGMPMGVGYRYDGESHREAWMRLVRADPCAYCNCPGGTVDHVVPQRGPNTEAGQVHNWLNYAGACESCNGSKDGEKLLLWLAVRLIRTRA